MLATFLAVAGMLASDAAWAHGRGRVGVFIGAPPPPFFSPWWYYPPPLYYSYPVVTVPAPRPPVYVEQEKPAAEGQRYWHYCFEPAGYYPDVKDCPSGWHKVAPEPEGPRSNR